MGETLEAAKKKMGLTSESQPAEKTEKKDSATELEEAISKLDNIEAKELLQAKARSLKADYEARAREAEERARRYGGNGGAKTITEQGEREKARQEIVANSLVLLERGVDPDVVARYIMGSSTATIPIALGGGGGQPGLTISDIGSIITMVKENSGGDTELRQTVKALNDTVTSLSKQIADGGGSRNSPSLLDQAKATVTLVNELRDAGFIQRESSGAAGEPIDNIKERNRHDERMEEIKNDRNYKEGMVDAVSNLAEDIGHGVASEVLMRKEAPLKKTGGALETFECDNCKATIYVTPETGNEVKCAKCGTVYRRGPQE